MTEQKTIILPMTDELKTAIHVLPKTISKKRASNQMLMDMIHITDGGDMITTDGHRLIIVHNYSPNAGTYKLLSRDKKQAILVENEKQPPSYKMILGQDFVEIYRKEDCKNNHACEIIRAIKEHNIDIDYLSETLSALKIDIHTELVVGVNNNETTIKMKYGNYTAIIMLMNKEV